MDHTQKLIYRVSEARKALGVSTATIYRMCQRGEFVKGKIGATRSVGITAESVNAVAAQMGISPAGQTASTVQVGSQMGS
ncbi:excisionase [Bordetella trematum]|uniref:DNA-binding protein n=1 Tax=Bordetella trematum TaxID=123899 RepID=A0A157SSZ5_9BORD|nr:helix-turn-helix domain-containing protein [Bordetella trematum]AZR94499.1 excisionase [Bordetella trematum]NNH19238.1 helix-turn-helix domain-containing protein [Bordetella trematum]CZZ87721.1 DNA-binding protein [Bordetella trematum]SAI73600.1 DNA-binding protein [Bordetella trematum]SUV97271.1 DNA-binding protein [Bordetella trematum]